MIFIGIDVMTRKNKITVILAICAVALPAIVSQMVGSNYEPDVSVSPKAEEADSESTEHEAFDEFRATIDMIVANDSDIYTWYVGSSLDPQTDRLTIIASLEYYDLTPDQQALFKKTFDDAWVKALKKHDPDAEPKIRFVDAFGEEI
ncbi:hypothetical protein D0962_37090 [Leptolyngbyaceae cyanobacterium CCMR0082]|uniref:Uncharacterized protein n=2 Tax=Adonisia TaxID=2950183 RepID=A0A6M0SIX6_9CYAN|nr:hypothetical protein [Adonisia turfae CCMR0082]